MTASLDHAMWFHRPFRADEWLLYHRTARRPRPVAGFADGQVFRRDGTLRGQRSRRRASMRPVR